MWRRRSKSNVAHLYMKVIRCSKDSSCYKVLWYPLLARKPRCVLNAVSRWNTQELMRLIYWMALHIHIFHSFLSAYNRLGTCVNFEAERPFQIPALAYTYTFEHRGQTHIHAIYQESIISPDMHFCQNTYLKTVIQVFFKTGWLYTLTIYIIWTVVATTTYSTCEESRHWTDCPHHAQL